MQSLLPANTWQLSSLLTLHPKHMPHEIKSSLSKNDIKENVKKHHQFLSEMKLKLKKKATKIT